MGEFLMQAATYNGKFSPGKCSEKIDGERCFWDGGFTRGLYLIHIPWHGGNGVSTGLWTRYGNPVYAPDTFLDKLPKHFLDGELHVAERKQGAERQEVSSIVRKKQPVSWEWEKIRYSCFDVPSKAAFITPRTYKDANQVDHMVINAHTLYSDYKDPTLDYDPWEVLSSSGYSHTFTTVWSVGEFDAIFKSITDSGGEGVMLRAISERWTSARVPWLQKRKAQFDFEAEVIGWKPGKGKFKSKVGAYICKGNNVTFSVNAADPAHREIGGIPDGSTVTIRCNGFTKAGVPQHAQIYFVWE